MTESSAPIYKQELTPGTMGIPGTPLHVHEQGGSPHIWYLADGTWTDIELVPTGGTPTLPRYVGTVHDVDGWMVFHVHVFAR